MSNSLLLPTAYLAPTNYYAILAQNQKCKIEYYEYFIRQSIRNRCEIYGSNGRLRLTIPKENKNLSKTTINEIKISYTDNWQRSHWNSINSAYNSSPFFEYYKDEFKPFFKKKETYLIDLNSKLQRKILEILNIDNQPTHSHKYHKNGKFTDLRNYDFKNKSQEKYDQVFMEKHGFMSNLSILDLLFNIGPESKTYLNILKT